MTDQRKPIGQTAMLEQALGLLTEAGEILDGVSFPPSAKPDDNLPHQLGELMALVRGSNRSNRERLLDAVRSAKEERALGEVAKVPIPPPGSKTGPLGDDEV